MCLLVSPLVSAWPARHLLVSDPQKVRTVAAVERSAFSQKFWIFKDVELCHDEKRLRVPRSLVLREKLRHQKFVTQDNCFASYRNCGSSGICQSFSVFC